MLMMTSFPKFALPLTPGLKVLSCYPHGCCEYEYDTVNAVIYETKMLGTPYQYKGRGYLGYHGFNMCGQCSEWFQTSIRIAGALLTPTGFVGITDTVKQSLHGVRNKSNKS